MQPYQTYFPQMNNGYNQQMPIQNPYMDRMNFLQNYQQNLQQPAQANQQMNVIGKIVDSVEMVKSMDIPMDGNLYYFPKADGTEVYGKQWIINECRTRILSFKPVLETEPNNLPSEDEKLKNEPFKEFTEVFEKRFDSLEKQINDLMTKSMTKTPVSKTKKESVDNE